MPTSPPSSPGQVPVGAAAGPSEAARAAFPLAEGPAPALRSSCSGGRGGSAGSAPAQRCSPLPANLAAVAPWPGPCPCATGPRGHQPRLELGWEQHREGSTRVCMHVRRQHQLPCVPWLCRHGRPCKGALGPRPRSAPSSAPWPGPVSRAHDRGRGWKAWPGAADPLDAVSWRSHIRPGPAGRMEGWWERDGSSSALVGLGPGWSSPDRE